MARGFFKDEHGRDVIWQKPNNWLKAWAILTILNILLPSSFIQRGAAYAATISLFVWACLELFSGSSNFRRLLGGLIAVWLILLQLLTLLHI